MFQYSWEYFLLILCKFDITRDKERTLDKLYFTGLVYHPSCRIFFAPNYVFQVEKMSFGFSNLEAGLTLMKGPVISF